MSALLDSLLYCQPLPKHMLANARTAAFVRADAGDDTCSIQERRDQIQEAIYALQNAIDELDKGRPAACDQFMADAINHLQVVPA